jgi:hypothetical protein
MGEKFKAKSFQNSFPIVVMVYFRHEIMYLFIKLYSIKLID